MSQSRSSQIRSTSVFLIIGFIALFAIVGMNFWLGERAQSYFDNVRGLGELGNVGTASAIASEVYNATGKRIRELPIRIDQLIV